MANQSTKNKRRAGAEAGGQSFKGDNCRTDHRDTHKKQKVYPKVKREG